MDKLAIQAKIMSFEAELHGSVTNRRRTIIQKELNKLSSIINELDKNKISTLRKKYNSEIEDIKSHHSDEIKKLIIQIQIKNQEIEFFKEEKRINKIKAQNIFKKLNARLTPDEIKLFLDGLAFIRMFL